jgi:putative heme-binding domain-containing protein
VHALALLRLGPPDAATRASLVARLLPLFPTGDERTDGDLVELLAAVRAPGLAAAVLPQLDAVRAAVPPPWAETAARNASYGGVIERMLANMPPTGQIALADALRTVADDLTPAQRRTFVEFLLAARQRRGGASYDGYLRAFVDAAWQSCPPGEQPALAELVAVAKAPLRRLSSPGPRGPGRDWDLPAATAAVRDLAAADLTRGRELFFAVGCASCHVFAGDGGVHGPDLTSLANKFTAADVLEAILEPSKVVSDQYSGSVLTQADGSTLFGRANRVDHGGVPHWEVVPALADATAVRVPAADVVSVAPSKLSPMPPDLVDRLSADELRHLVAFLLSGTKPATRR